MATLGEFGSLLQLGFGIGVGLSVFEAPMRFRVTKIGNSINNQISIIAGVGTFRSNQMRADLSELNLDFRDIERKLEQFHIVAFFAAIFGSTVNIVMLILASMYAQYNIGDGFQYALIFISSIYYLVIILVMDRIVCFYLSGIIKRLKKITS